MKRAVQTQVTQSIRREYESFTSDCYSFSLHSISPLRSTLSNPIAPQQQMDFLSFDPMIGAVSLLGTLVFGLIAAVAWLFWQQSKLFTNMNSLVVAFSELVHQTQPPPVEAPVDDRASVEEDDTHSEKAEPEVVDGPPPPLDTDTLETKTKKELQDILTKRGIPFGRADSKTVLLSLLKATA